MSAAIATFLKRIAVYAASSKKGLTIIASVVLGLLLVLMAPILAIVAVFNSEVSYDEKELQSYVEENVGNIGFDYDIANEQMLAVKKLLKESQAEERYFEAEVLYSLGLDKYATIYGFSDRLTNCILSSKNDVELIQNVNKEFSTEVKLEDFQKLVKDIRKK